MFEGCEGEGRGNKILGGYKGYSLMMFEIFRGREGLQLIVFSDSFVTDGG